MIKVGTVKELWRFPVKSMGGETLPQARVCTMGLAGDRGWALVNAETGDIVGAKTLPRLLELSGRYIGEVPEERVFTDAVPAVEITFPDGSRASLPDADKRISELIGKPLKLVPLEPPENTAHYRFSNPPGEAEFEKMMNASPDDSLPDFAHVDPELMLLLAEHATPPGSYADAYALHLITTASLARLAAEGGGDANVRRFRPNLLIDTDDVNPDWLEFEWEGGTLHIGETLLQVHSRTIRCSMPARSQPAYDLPAAPHVSKTLFRETGRYLGSNINVLQDGVIRTGDPVFLEK